MNILITSASKKVTLVKCFKNAIEKEGGGKVYAADINPLSAALYMADGHFLVPPDNDPEFIAALIDICKAHKIRLIVPTRDEELPVFAASREMFSSIGTAIMVAPPETIAICQDKRMFVDYCLLRGVGTPRRYNISSDGMVLDSISYPAFLKPRFGKGGSGTARVDNEDSLRYLLRSEPEAIVQEYVQAPEYAIDVFVDFAGQVISAVPRERVWVFGGESFIGKTVNDPALILGAVRLSGMLGLVGHNTIQCFLDGGEVKFIEINPRYGGGASLGIAAGADTPRFLIKLLKGEKLNPVIGEFKDSLYMLRYTDEMYMDSPYEKAAK
ncbi:ATP-grasp domain-containing protein [Candidatus Magnetominusculus dajiuhuensis]|uniref:ATP-grasp domain-containing protein n=1 Tax=Candidatus Magnetominusculus dajiuhuensis TaxID=3137712 RepID=UPI003B4345CD